MLNYQQTEFLTYDRQRGFLAEAEARRLTAACVASRPSLAQRTRCWIGAHLVQWGSTLQGETAASALSLHASAQPAHQ